MRYLLLAVFSLFFLNANAGHISAGEISYTHVSGLTYHFTVKLYRDCMGGPTPLSMPLKQHSTSLAQNLTAALSLNNPVAYYNPWCSNVANPCGGGVYGGYEFDIYEGNVTLPAAANDWMFSTEICCRNNSVMNLNNPGSFNIMVLATLDNLTGGNTNNSVQFVQQHPLIYNAGSVYNLLQTAFDPDGDSLDFQLIAPMHTVNVNGIVQNCMYAGGYSPSYPFNGNIILNNQTGTLSFIDSVQGVFTVAIKVNEYRNGLLIGSGSRDLELKFSNVATNIVPFLSGVNGGNNYHTVIHACPGNSLSFTINSMDTNAGDSVYISNNTYSIPGSTLTLSNAVQPVATFNWSPTPADVRPEPYVLGLTARDNYCNLNGMQDFVYLIYVTQCNTDTVWPGDANADYVVDNYDVLNIGLANNATGVLRPAATTNWTAQYCNDWVDTFVNAVNYKHADCDGNGTVNNTDISAVTLNYGQFHLKTHIAGKYKTRGFPDLFFNTNGIQAVAGNTLNIPVHLGDNTSPMNSIYGIAGTIMISNNLSNNIVLSNTVSWLGTNANSFLFQKNTAGYNELAFTLVRNNQNAVSGNGEIAILQVPVDAAALLGSELVLQFADLKLIDANGNAIVDYNALSDTLVIMAPAGINDNESLPGVSVYPNPVTDLLTIQIKDSEPGVYRMEMHDATGRLLYAEKISGDKLIIPLGHFAKGMYFVKVLKDEQVLGNSRIILSHK